VREWTFERNDQASAAARRALAVALAGLLPAERLEDVLLATSELVSNAVRHARAPGGSILLRAGLRDHRLEIEVHDPGAGFDPRGTLDPSPLADSGFGLRIVEQVTDRWGVAPGRPTRVWFAVEV
jgi:serine/threonine-protein kinase RsbW